MLTAQVVHLPCEVAAHVPNIVQASIGIRTGSLIIAPLCPQKQLLHTSPWNFADWSHCLSADDVGVMHLTGMHHSGTLSICLYTAHLPEQVDNFHNWITVCHETNAMNKAACVACKWHTQVNKVSGVSSFKLGQQQGNPPLSFLVSIPSPLFPSLSHHSYTLFFLPLAPAVKLTHCLFLH